MAWLLFTWHVDGFASKSPFPLFQGWGSTSKASSAISQNVLSIEKDLIAAIGELQGRSKGDARAKAKVESLLSVLEEKGGINDPACNPTVDGKWRLIFTSTPGTASPIQRSFVGVDGWSIYQNIEIFNPDTPATVTNVVDFGPKIGRLDVCALASTIARPLEGFTPRRGDGKIFGLNIFGVSKTGEENTPAVPGNRIDFKFDIAGFKFELIPLTIPYPVPFRYLGDEVKGWIDITYLSPGKGPGAVRIARGNKGTVFCLIRE